MFACALPPLKSLVQCCWLQQLTDGRWMGFIFFLFFPTLSFISADHHELLYIRGHRGVERCDRGGVPEEPGPHEVPLDPLSALSRQEGLPLTGPDRTLLNTR